MLTYHKTTVTRQKNNWVNLCDSVIIAAITNVSIQLDCKLVKPQTNGENETRGHLVCTIN